MAYTSGKLTKNLVRTLGPGRHGDGHGLYLVVDPSGARRWIVILGVNIQPSEFLKPAFTVLIAWLFAESARRPEMPATTLAFAMAGLVATLLVLEPELSASRCRLFLLESVAHAS